MVMMVLAQGFYYITIILMTFYVFDSKVITNRSRLWNETVTNMSDTTCKQDKDEIYKEVHYFLVSVAQKAWELCEKIPFYGVGERTFWMSLRFFSSVNDVFDMNTYIVCRINQRWMAIISGLSKHGSISLVNTGLTTDVTGIYKQSAWKNLSVTASRYFLLNI